MPIYWVTIANGRLLNDQGKGKYTFCSHQGQSTVGCLLLNFLDFATVSHFDILEFNEFSDHAPVFFSFYLDCNDALENRYENRNDNEISRTIVWDNAKVENFKSVLILNQRSHSTFDVRC